MIKTNYLQLNESFLLMIISKEVNIAFSRNTPKLLEEEAKWLKDNLPIRNLLTDTIINPENCMILFNDTLKNVMNFFKTRSIVRIYNKGEFKLTDFVQQTEAGFKNYKFVETKNEANWAKDLIEEGIGTNSDKNFYKEEQNFYSNPEIIAEYRKKYPRPTANVATAFESFISAIDYLTCGIGYFILIKIN